MSDTMLLGVLRMPYDLAMMTELARAQYHSRVQEAAARIESDADTIETLRRERDAAVAKAAEALRADAERYRWLTRPGERIGDNWRTAWHKWDGSDGKAGFDAAIDSARSA